MKDLPKVGQVVKLNNYGIMLIGGLMSIEMANQAENMTITSVDNNSITNDVDTFIIEVDQPLINQYMIYNHCVDLK